MLGDFEVVQVGQVAVAGVHAPDLLVGVVDDHLFALAEALGGDHALPPRQHLARPVLLDLQVGGVQLPRQRVEPHEVAAFVEDHRPRRARPRVGGAEQVARGGAFVVDGHFQDRRGEVGGRVEVLHLLEVFVGLGRGGPVQPLVGVGDDEVEGEAVGGDAELGLHPHRLARVEGPARDEARPVALGVGPQRSPVGAAGGSADADRGDRLAGHADDADLGVRRGVVGVGQRRDRDAAARAARRRR